jgi:hypothetical protein
LIGALANITFDPVKLTVGFGFGQSNVTNELKNNRAWNADISNVLGSAIIAVNVGGEYTRQFNYPAVVTSSLAEVNNAHYAGVSGGAGEIFVGMTPTITILEGGVLYKNNPKAAIEQMYKQYTDVNARIFDLKTISQDQIDTPQHLKTTLLSRYRNEYTKISTGTSNNEKLMTKFLDNNRAFFETNIDQMVQYIQNENLCAATNTADKPVESMQALISILHTGLSNSWRETMYENIAGKTHLSKAGIGAGVMLIPGVYPLVYPKVALQFTHWRNNYLSREGQRLVDAKIIAQGKVEAADIFAPTPPSIEAYGEYISAIFGLREYVDGKWTSTLKTEKTPEGHLKLTYLGSKPGCIADLIDIRAAGNQKVLDNIKVSEDEKSLIIGDVGQILAYTQADGTGKRCYLLLGAGTTQNTCRLDAQDIKAHHGLPKDTMTFTSTTETKTPQKSGEAALTNIDWSQVETKTMSFGEFFEFPENSTLLTARNEISKLIDSLMELENGKPDTYKQFISRTSHSIDDNKDISEKEIISAISYLETLL